MPYTLTKGLLWFLLALLIGIVIGWLLRSIRATSQLRAVRAARHEPAERDRLPAELTGRNRATTPATGDTDPGPPTPAAQPAAEPDGAAPSTQAPSTPAPEPDEPGAGDTHVVQLTESVEIVEMVARPPGPDDALSKAPDTATETATGTGSETETDTDTDTGTDTDTDTGTGTEIGTGTTMRADAPPAAIDLSAAAAVPGKRIKLDDLTAIEGIGPAVAGLCHGIGITTWTDLADTEVSLLRTMLADAGPRFSAHRPDTWPQQARLLVSGRWAEFQSLVASLDSDKLGE